ncbi:MAG TPA: response regulator, partial [Allocoleopsis sp.]
QNPTYCYTIVEFDSGAAAIEFFRQQNSKVEIDVVVLDYVLPDCDGLDVLHQLHQLWQTVPVIMLTGHGSETIAVQAMKAGAQDYLIKNMLTPERFVYSIEAVLNQTRLTRQLEQSQKQQQLLATLTLRTRRSLELAPILSTVVEDVRQLLETDRVLVYQFMNEGNGTIVAESVLPQWQPSLGRQIQDTYFQQQNSNPYQAGRRLAVDNIYQAGFSECHLQLLEQFQTQALMVVPILLDAQELDLQKLDSQALNSQALNSQALNSQALNSQGLNSQEVNPATVVTSHNVRLWGLLAVHHATPRQWGSTELDFLEQVATQLSIAIQQAELYHNLRHLNTELQAKVVTRTTALQQLTTLQQAILDSTTHSIVSVTPDGIITTFNRGA